MSEFQSSSSYSNEHADIHESFTTPAEPDQVSELSEISRAICRYAASRAEILPRRNYMVTTDTHDMYTDIALSAPHVRPGYHNVTTRIGQDLDGNTTILWRRMENGHTSATRNRIVRRITMLTLGDSPEGASRPTERFFEEDGTWEGYDFVPDKFYETPAHIKDYHDLSLGTARGVLNYLRRVIDDMPSDVRASIPLRDEASRLRAIDPLAPSVTVPPLQIPSPRLRGAAPVASPTQPSQKLASSSEPESTPEAAPTEDSRSRVVRYLKGLFRPKPQES